LPSVQQGFAYPYFYAPYGFGQPVGPLPPPLQQAAPQQADQKHTSPFLFELALDSHGTRSVQKVIECASTPAERQLILAAISPEHRIVRLIRDLNGNHCIQKCLDTYNVVENAPIFAEVRAELMTVATHQHGCCVLQRCIDVASPETSAELLAEIHTNATKLIRDKYGNYAFQYALEKHRAAGDQDQADALVQRLKGSFAELMQQKFSSHAVEKCIELASEPVRSAIVEEVIDSGELSKVAADMFGNYVVQKILTVSRQEQRQRVARLLYNDPLVRSSQFSKHVVGLCEKALSGERSERGRRNQQSGDKSGYGGRRN